MSDQSSVEIEESATDSGVLESSVEAVTTDTTPSAQAKPVADDKREKKPSVGKIFLIAAIVVIAAIAVLFFGTRQVVPSMTVVTESSLKKAINIDELSTAEFVYNGIAEQYKEDGEDVDFRVAYHATVKAGIRMSDIDFEVDPIARTVKPILPDIVINGVTVDVNNVDYMPENPKNAKLKEVFKLCEEDAKSEANKASDLQDVARDNLKSVVEALTKPILDSADYSLTWEDSASQLIEDAEADASSDGADKDKSED